MPISDSTAEYVKRRSGLRIRYSLKTALFVVTLLTISLAFLVDRRITGSIEFWDRALRNIICENIATIPQGMSLVDSSAPATTAQLQESQFVELRKAGLLSGNSLRSVSNATSWTPAITLDVSQELNEQTPIVVANRLLQHYETGLADHGLTRIASAPGTCDPATSEPSAVWISNREDMNTVVVIDVRVQQDTNHGNVRIRHIARPINRL